MCSSMAAPRGNLNPQAALYIPLSHQITLFPPPPPPPAAPVRFLPPPPPPSLIPYPTQSPPIFAPSLHATFSSLSFTHFQSPPPPPPPQPPTPPTEAVRAEETESFLKSRNGKRYVNRPPRARVSDSSGRGSRFGKYNERHKLLKGQTSNFSEERKGGGSWSDLKKHGMRPLVEEEGKTTIMIKNIPYEFTRQMLIDFLDEHCMSENQKSESRRSNKPPSAYDFLYLPIDFKTKKNKGYAFVNFTEPAAVWKFFNAFDFTRWDYKESTKIRRIICARIQGKEALVQHFQRSYFECESDEFLPICFTPARDGSGDSVETTTVGRRSGKGALLGY